MRLVPVLTLPTCPLHSVEATRAIEKQLITSALDERWMLKAGEASARLARAIAPHAQNIVIACGTGHNGGDGYAMAAALRQASLSYGANVQVMQVGTSALPPLIQSMRARALALGVREIRVWPEHVDLAVDAMLGIGAKHAPNPELTQVLLHFQSAPIVLSLDIPSGLHADTGEWLVDEPQMASPNPSQSRYTLSLLTVKTGLKTGDGRDWGGEVWWSDLGAEWTDAIDTRPSAVLNNQGPPNTHHPHRSHKGSFGDVIVLAGQAPSGGRAGMLGAGILAARTAVHSGAGRVTWVPLVSSEALPLLDWAQPDLMVRHLNQWRQESPNERQVWAVGCGGGDAVADILPLALSHPGLVILDADALNHIAADSRWRESFAKRGQQGRLQVYTPHPLEAGRLLGLTAAQVQRDRLGCAQQLADWLCGVVVLKGSGSVIAAPELRPLINASGNPRLATGGSGDVLAGAIAGRLAASLPSLLDTEKPAAWEACQSIVATTVWEHGHIADGWPAHQALTSSRLAEAFCRG